MTPRHDAGPRLSALWFADLSGFTELAALDESAALSAARTLQRTARAVVDAHGGRVVKFIGDGALAEFQSVHAAANAALALRDAYDRSMRSRRHAPDLRIGMHLGEIRYTEDGDVLGDGVNLASRLQHDAAPGEVLVSADVCRQLRRSVEFSLGPGTERVLRGVAEPTIAHRLESSRTEPEAPAAGRAGRWTSADAETGPLIGRERELEALTGGLDDLDSHTGTTLLITGEAGVGKTRLLRALAEEAAARGIDVASGRAFPLESGIPYALVTDALLPVVRRLSSSEVASMARGAGAELAHLFPMLDVNAAPRAPAEHPAELKGRLLWAFAQFLSGLSSRGPLVVILDDVQWADPSSLELLHFVARQTANDPILFALCYRAGEHGMPKTLRALERALLTLRVARLYRIDPLAVADFEAFLGGVIDATSENARSFGGRLHQWTRGNMFFAQEAIRSLIASGRIRSAEGGWIDTDLASIELPRTVREAVLERLDGLHSNARTVAEIVATAGASAEYDLILDVARADEDQILRAIDELRRECILIEQTEDETVTCDFRHPIARQVVYSEIGPARRRRLHGTIARALEHRFGAAAIEHADVLAYHFALAGSDTPVASSAALYLGAAGRAALARHADKEAANYLLRALRRRGVVLPGEEEPGGVEWDADVWRLIAELAHAYQRLGMYARAVSLLKGLLEDAERRGDERSAADAHRRIALNCYWSGRYKTALRQISAGIAVADRQGSPGLGARLELARAACLQELGHAEQARACAERARTIAEAQSDEGLLGRAHRALLLIHTWVGPPDLARAHGRRAIECAHRSGDLTVAFFGHWTLSVLEGLTGNLDQMVEHIRAGRDVADRLSSPLLRLWTDELRIEHAWATGEWSEGIELGDAAIELARALNQRTLLPRLLVWTSLLRLARGEHGPALAGLKEAWVVSGASGRGDAIDVHTVVPAHIGRAAYHLAQQRYDQAIRVAERGLRIADRSGYSFWAIHRLLPVMAEAYLQLGDLDGARRVERRIRHDSNRLGHTLGLAWADACHALVVWLQGDIEGGARLLRGAAETLDQIPIVSHGARLRRQLAGRLIELGDLDGATRELTRAHNTFSRLGAVPELEKTNLMFAEIGASPPTPPADG